MINLYENISNLCAEHGITTGKLSNDIGISRGILSDLKNGRKKTLSIDTVAKIANYFNVSIDKLVYGDTDFTKQPLAMVSDNTENIKDFYKKKTP